MTGLDRGLTPICTGWFTALNTRHHRAALIAFMVVVIGHWSEHIAQAYELWARDWPLPRARGVLDMPFPCLIKSEWLHYGYALVVLIGLFRLPGEPAAERRRRWPLPSQFHVFSSDGAEAAAVPWFTVSTSPATGPAPPAWNAAVGHVPLTKDPLSLLLVLIRPGAGRGAADRYARPPGSGQALTWRIKGPRHRPDTVQAPPLPAELSAGTLAEKGQPHSRSNYRDITDRRGRTARWKRTDHGGRATVVATASVRRRR